MTDQLTQENRQQIAELVKQDSVLKGSIIEQIFTALLNPSSEDYTNTPVGEGEEIIGTVNELEAAILTASTSIKNTSDVILESGETWENKNTLTTLKETHDALGKLFWSSISGRLLKEDGESVSLRAGNQLVSVKDDFPPFGIAAMMSVLGEMEGDGPRARRTVLEKSDEELETCPCPSCQGELRRRRQSANVEETSG